MTTKKTIELSGFTGTEAYHKLSLMANVKGTDGIAYLCKEAKCYWLIDIIASVQSVKEVRANRNFLIWRVMKKDDGCIVTAHWDSESDGSYDKSKRCYRQEVEYTDFPFKEFDDVFEFYQEGDVILLKSEH